jgi:hypothetical protein
LAEDVIATAQQLAQRQAALACRAEDENLGD